MSVMDMTSAVLGMIPDSTNPCTSTRSRTNPRCRRGSSPPAPRTATGRPRRHGTRPTSGRLEIRVVDLTADAVNVICDDRIIPAMKYRVPAKTSGFTVGQLILDADSGAYAAGLTADDTSRRYQVRVLRFRFTWTRP